MMCCPDRGLKMCDSLASTVYTDECEFQKGHIYRKNRIGGVWLLFVPSCLLLSFPFVPRMPIDLEMFSDTVMSVGRQDNRGCARSLFFSMAHAAEASGDFFPDGPPFDDSSTEKENPPIFQSGGARQPGWCEEGKQNWEAEGQCSFSNADNVLFHQQEGISEEEETLSSEDSDPVFDSRRRHLSTKSLEHASTDGEDLDSAELDTPSEGQSMEEFDAQSSEEQDVDDVSTESDGDDIPNILKKASKPVVTETVKTNSVVVVSSDPLNLKPVGSNFSSTGLQGNGVVFERRLGSQIRSSGFRNITQNFAGQVILDDFHHMSSAHKKDVLSCPPGFDFATQGVCSLLKTEEARVSCPLGSESARIGKCALYSGPIQDCPEGFHIGSGGKCSRMHKQDVSSVCPQGTAIDGKWCKPLLEEAPQCPHGYKLDTSNAVCKKVLAAYARCPLGFVAKGVRCIRQTDPIVNCPRGSHLFPAPPASSVASNPSLLDIPLFLLNSEIMDSARLLAIVRFANVADRPEIDYSRWSVCKRSIEYPARCPDGFEYVGDTHNSCVRRVPSIAAPCQAGFVSTKDGFCEKISKINPEAICPNGGHIAGDGRSCKSIQHEQPVCPVGFVHITASGSPGFKADFDGNLLSAGTAECVQIASSIASCPVGFELLPQSPGLTPICRQVVFIEKEAGCADGFEMVHGQCKAIKNVEPLRKCPEKSSWNGNSCIQRTQKEAKLHCPPGFTLENERHEFLKDTAKLKNYMLHHYVKAEKHQNCVRTVEYDCSFAVFHEECDPEIRIMDQPDPAFFPLHNFAPLPTVEFPMDPQERDVRVNHLPASIIRDYHVKPEPFPQSSKPTKGVKQPKRMRKRLLVSEDPNGWPRIVVQEVPTQLFSADRDGSVPFEQYVLDMKASESKRNLGVPKKEALGDKKFHKKLQKPIIVSKPSQLLHKPLGCKDVPIVLSKSCEREEVAPIVVVCPPGSTQIGRSICVTDVAVDALVACRESEGERPDGQGRCLRVVFGTRIWRCPRGTQPTGEGCAQYIEIPIGVTCPPSFQLTSDRSACFRLSNKVNLNPTVTVYPATLTCAAHVGAVLIGQYCVLAEVVERGSVCPEGTITVTSEQGDLMPDPTCLHQVPKNPPFSRAEYVVPENSCSTGSFLENYKPGLGGENSIEAVSSAKCVEEAPGREYECPQGFLLQPSAVGHENVCSSTVEPSNRDSAISKVPPTLSCPLGFTLEYEGLTANGQEVCVNVEHALPVAFCPDGFEPVGPTPLDADCVKYIPMEYSCPKGYSLRPTDSACVFESVSPAIVTTRA